MASGAERPVGVGAVVARVAVVLSGAALGLMVWGTYRLAQSPLVCAEQRADEERRAAEHDRHASDDRPDADRALSA